MATPSLNGSSGRSKGGRFAPGNKEGRGNPMASQVNRLRVAMFKAVKDGDITAIVKKLITEAKQGNVMAAKEVLDRLLGKPVQTLEHSGPEGGPIESEFDLSKASFEELEYLKTLRDELKKRAGGDNEKEDHANIESRSEEGPTT